MLGDTSEPHYTRPRHCAMPPKRHENRGSTSHLVWSLRLLLSGVRNDSLLRSRGRFLLGIQYPEQRSTVAAACISTTCVESWNACAGLHLCSRIFGVGSSVVDRALRVDVKHVVSMGGYCQHCHCTHSRYTRIFSGRYIGITSTSFCTSPNH